MIFENTHEAIVDRETWELAQKLRKTTRRIDHMFMTMNTKPKMTAEQRIQRSIERNEAELQKAEEKRKQLKGQRRELEKEAYENRLTTRATMLEEFLLEPELLTNEDVRNYLAYLFNYPANQQRLQKLIDDRKAQLAATE